MNIYLTQIIQNSSTLAQSAERVFLVNFLIFCQIWGFLRLICGVLQSWETEKLEIFYFYQVEKCMY